jgi:hypothetical protein
MDGRAELAGVMVSSTGALSGEPSRRFAVDAPASAESGCMSVMSE